MPSSALALCWRKFVSWNSRRGALKGRKSSTLYVSEQLEFRTLLTTMTLNGTSGADVIIFQQADATHDTFTLNGVANTFSTTGVTSIVINSLAGTDQITILNCGSGIPIAINGTGTDTVTLGNSGDMQGLLSGITLFGTAGQMSLIADDSADPTTRTVTISPTDIEGLSPAGIFFTAGNLASIKVVGGHGGGFIGTGGNGAGNLFSVIGTSGSTTISIDGGVKTPGQAGSFNMLTGPSVNQTWNMTGVNSGSVGQITFTNMPNLVGGTADDRFAFAKNSIFNTVDGGGGNDTAVSPIGFGDTWAIFDTNMTIFNEASLHNIPNLVGGNTTTGFDEFTFAGGNLTGSIDGGGGNAQIRAGNSSNTFTITGANSGTYNGATFQHVPSLFAGLGSNATFAFGVGGSVTSIQGFGSSEVVIGPDQTNAWEITGAKTGRLNSSGATNNLSGITSFVGGSGSDTFTLDTAAAVAGNFDGGGGTDTLIAPNTINNWVINGNNSGTLGSATFSNIENLTGGNTTDNFAFQGSGAVGSIVGGAGPGTLDYSAFATRTIVNLQTNTASGVSGTVTGVQNVVGTPNNDQIRGSNSGGTITAAGGNDFLIGGTGDDTFIVAPGQGVGTYINGVSGNDTVVAPPLTNTWNITGVNMGTINGVTFANIPNLIGSDGEDTFLFGPTGVITGNIDGAGNFNTLDYSGRTTGAVVNLATKKATAVGGSAFSFRIVTGSPGNDTIVADGLGDILRGGGGNDNLVGGAGADAFALATGQGTSTKVSGGGGNDLLVGPNTDSTWNITGTNAGTLNGASFNGIRGLLGGTGADTFAFGPAGVISGNIDGGTGFGLNTIDDSGRSVGIVAMLQTSTITSLGGTYSNINTIKGSSGTDTITGGNGSNVWNITGTNSGTVNNSFSFSGFENLTGGGSIDVFSFSGSGNITGLVRGGGFGGTPFDLLDYSALSTGVVVDLSTGVAARTGGVSAIWNVTGSTGNDTLTAATAGSKIDGTAGDDTLIGGPGNDIFTVEPAQGSGTTFDGRGGTNTLVGPDSNNAWNITGVNTGTLNLASYRNVQNLTGFLLDDTFTFGPSGVQTGNIDGGDGTNTLDYSTRSAGIVVNLSTSSSTAIAGKITNIGVVVGSSGADVIVGANGPNTWNILSQNAGNVNGAFSFSSVESLIGGTDVDTFVLSNGVGVSGTINGRLGANNWIDFSAYTPPVSVDLNAGTATNTAGISNIQNVRGGSGGNTLTGNSAGNILIGGSGVDTITGGSGRSLLIGGSGVDAVTGGSADDIVIGGFTNFTNPVLASILAEWQSANDYATRVAHLKGLQPGGLNGTNVLMFGDSVHDDFVINTLTGGAGTDWFFQGASDLMTDHQAGEQVN